MKSLTKQVLQQPDHLPTRFFRNLLAALANLAPTAAMRDLALESLAAEDYSGYLWLFSNHDRWGPLLVLAGRLLLRGDERLPILFEEVWTAANQWLRQDVQARGVLIKLIADRCPKAFRDDMAVFERLPDPVTIYRGFKGRNQKSHSWTISEAIAKDFAERYSRDPGIFSGEPEVPRVTVLTVSKADVLFYTNGREEQEIVLRQPMRGKVLRSLAVMTAS